MDVCPRKLRDFKNVAAICNYFQAASDVANESRIFGGGKCKCDAARSLSLLFVGLKA